MKVLVYHGDSDDEWPFKKTLDQLIDHPATEDDPTTTFHDAEIVHVERDSNDCYSLYTEPGYIYLTLTQKDFDAIRNFVDARPDDDVLEHVKSVIRREYDWHTYRDSYFDALDSSFEPSAYRKMSDAEIINDFLFAFQLTEKIDKEQ